MPKKFTHKYNIWQRNPKGLKRCLVVRYGAIGDAILSASILPQLKKQGYYVTYNSAPNGHEIVKHDPNIDEFIIQGKDFVPNQELGPYWQQIHLEGRYDKIVNLCESIEGGLLTLPGRLQHDYPDDVRRNMFGKVNYLERTHDIAGVPYEFLPKFYPNAEEIGEAKRQRAKIDAPVIVWAINGSAHHKTYPWVQVVIAWLLEHTPTHIFLLGDEGPGKDLQTGIIETLKKDGIEWGDRIHEMAGKWKIRESLSFAQVADCVVGPETGILNSVCMEKNAKVIYLSHSSHENLTKYWKNTTVLEPEKAKAPCWPCHRLHYNWDYCHQDKTTSTSACSSAVSPKRTFEAIMEALHYKQVVKTYELEPEPPFTPPGGTSGMVRKAA